MLSSLSAIAKDPQPGIEGKDFDVWVRIKNVSPFSFDSVQFGNRDTQEIALKRGEYSKYRGVTRAYRSIPASVRIGTELFRLVIWDYIGETPLSSGCYTY